MATIPTIPSFTAGTAPSIATLNQLRSCGFFIGEQQVAASLKRATDQTGIAANTPTAVSWTVKELDSDSMFSGSTPTRLTVVTRGWYRFAAIIAMTVTGAAFYGAWLQVTFGSSNPRASVGTTAIFGSERGSSAATADEVSFHAGGPAPCVLYPGDYVEVIVQSSTAISVVHDYHNSTNLDSAGFADGSSCLYCFYTGYGT
jgi:hypothetical protein